MPGLVINGREHVWPGLQIVNFRDDPRVRLKLGEDGRRRRTSWVRSICNHTTMGLPATIEPGTGPHGGAYDTFAWWNDPESGSAGAHLEVDRDAMIYCTADLVLEVSYGATSLNEVCVNVEARQGHGADHALNQAQLEAWAELNVALCALLGIARQYHWPYLHGPVPRLHAGGGDCVGVFGHRDQTGAKGVGDPGDEIFQALGRRGFEAFDFSQDEDLVAWRERQRRLNALGWTPALAVDGVPGPLTLKAWGALGDRTHNGYVEG